MSVLVSPEAQKPSTPPMPSEQKDDNVAFTFQYLLVFVAAAVVSFFVIFVVLLLLRKRRTNRLRHHLMPLYSFDTSDDCQEWEAELLDEDVDSCTFKNGYKSMAFHAQQ